MTPAELIVDSFAGGGGASLGITWALGRAPDIAINHDREAIALHAANHPESRHYAEDVWKIDPVGVCAGRPVGLMWLSPDCTHFSKAKGAKPVSKKIRGLAWVAVRWATAVRPRIIVLENVEEFQTWGPVSRATCRPDPARRGYTFRRFVSRLRRLGYAVEWRELRACDFGAPTIRKRFFLVARCDGQPIRWPRPTHGKGRPHPWRTAAECIEWSIPCPSIFLSKEEARAIGVKRPLAEATLRRIANGIRRYVIEAPNPFIVPMQHQNRPVAIDEPLQTITTQGNKFNLVVPYTVPVTHGGDDRVHSIDEPVRTITGAHRGEHALISPTLIQTGYGEDRKRNGGEGQAPRVPGLDKPLGTVVGCGVKHALVSAFLAKHYGGHETPGASLGAPISTITTQDHHHLVRAFLVQYYSQGGQTASLAQPMRTVTALDRLGLVTVHGVEYAIADIGMRMLVPRELYRAQGFPDSYRIEIEYEGKPLSKAAQVRMCGNSVPPAVAAAVIRANVDDTALAVEDDQFALEVA